MRDLNRDPSHRLFGHAPICVALLAVLTISTSALAQGVSGAPTEPGARIVAPAFANATNAAVAGIGTDAFSDDPQPAADLAAPAVFRVRASADGDALAQADGPLDDQALADQRGGTRNNMVMVSVTPATLKNNVTLWDEIVPPMPMPQPSDAARAAQGNNVSYTRK